MAVLIRTAMLVPETDNDGRRFPAAAWRELEERLLQFGGFTQPPLSAGVWTGGSRVYRDRSRRYEVGLSSWAEFPAWFAIVLWARQRFLQEAMYIEVAGTAEVIGS